MANTVRVVGADQFHELGKRLKAAGQKGLRREMGKGLRKGAAPLVADAQERVRGLPIQGHRGGASARQARAQHALGKRKKLTERAKLKAHGGSGLRETVARATSAKVSTGARSSSLRVRAAQAKMPPSQRALPRYLNRGRWRHPTFGHDPWVEQTTPPAWFDDAMEAKGPAVRDAAVEMVAEYIAKLA